MSIRIKNSILCTLLCLWSSAVVFAETPDPFGTSAELPLRPALRLGGGEGDPCASAMPAGALDLPDVVNLALCNNPQTREVWASARVQASQVGVSRGSFLPDISASASGNRNFPGEKQRSIGLTLSYLLLDFGERAANVENARQLLAAASATQDGTVQSVFLSAVQAFYQTQAAQAALDAAHESERAAKRSFAAAEARHLAGSATPADKLQAQTAWSQATLNRISTDGNLKKARGGLANIIGLEAHHNVVLAQPFPMESPSPQSSPASGRGGERESLSSIQAGGEASARDSTLNNPHPNPDGTTSHSTNLANNASQVAGYLPLAGEGADVFSPDGEKLKIFEQNITALIEEAKLRRPDLRAAAAQVKAAQASVDAARAAGKPSVSLTASTSVIQIAGDNSNDAAIGINVKMPLFSGFAPTYRVRAAEAQVEARQAQLERARLQVALEVWNAYQNLVTSTQSMRATADLQASAEQSDRVALGRYKAGVGNILDVLNAQSALASARQQRIQSTLDWNISRAALAQAMGNLDENLLKELPDGIRRN